MWQLDKGVKNYTVTYIAVRMLRAPENIVVGETFVISSHPHRPPMSWSGMEKYFFNKSPHNFKITFRKKNLFNIKSCNNVQQFKSTHNMKINWCHLCFNGLLINPLSLAFCCVDDNIHFFLRLLLLLPALIYYRFFPLCELH